MKRYTMPILPVWLLLTKMATVLFILASSAIHLATASLVNVAKGKSASMSSSKSGYSAESDVDGNTDTGGYTPQYIIDTASLVNMALNKPASMSSSVNGYSAGTAVDGKFADGWGGDIIIDTGTGHDFAWWKVDLQGEVQDATVRIYFRTPYTRARNGVELYTSTSPFPDSNPTSQGQLCHTVTGDPSGSDIPDVYSVTCPGRWSYLLLYTNTSNDKRGPVLDFGEVQVLGCSNGTYGEDCTKLCSSRNCVTMTTCERDGRCPDGCLSGWTGVDCTQALPPCTDNNYYGQNCDNLCSVRKCKAPSTSSCDRLTGSCDYGCYDGWRQEDCTKECGSGSYGPSCALVCNNRMCLDGSSPCDHVTGQCVDGCQAGYKEPDCTRQCDSGSYGSGCSLNCTARKCRNPAGTCPHADGRCVNGCQPGYKGTDCIHKCDSGFYGDGCSLSCIARNCSIKSSECDHVTGRCESGCQAGYQGTDCIQECGSGSYGPSCALVCNNRMCLDGSSPCDHVTGQCVGGCQDGYQELDCTQKCPAGTFGSDCTSCSTRHCQGESDCPADGTCSQGCKDGYTGQTCMQTCPRNLYGPSCSMTCGNCSSDDACHHVTGNCPSGCKSGWRTQKCNEVCMDGTYGPDCTEKCGQCDGTCGSVDGRCSAGCLEGYYGPYCRECGYCDGVCDRVNGLCYVGCLDGYSGAWCNVTRPTDETPVYSTAASVVGAVIGTFLLMVLVIGGTILCLVRQDRLQWVKNPEDKKLVHVSRDGTQMSNIVSQPSDVTEHVHSSSHVYNNDYAVLDSGTRAADKDYDVIEQKHYQNV